jgi:hypothetical protein
MTSSSGGDSGGDSNPSGDWQNVTANLAGMDSECGNMSFLSAKPDEDMLIAGIAQKGLWASTDGGMSWQQLGTGKGSAAITNRTSAFVYDPDMPTRFWESGTYNDAGVYVTEDDGKTFKALGDISRIDLVSVDLSDPARKTLVAGGHEQPKDVFLSVNGGTTWSTIGGSLPDNTKYCTHPVLLDSKTILVGCAGNGTIGGIFRSIDAGKTWAAASTDGGAAAPLVASDGTIYWANDGNQGLAASTDSGVSFKSLVGFGVVNAFNPIELPDKRLAMMAPSNVVVVSSDNGVTWKPVTSALPSSQNGFAGPVYSVQQKAFFAWNATCGFNGPVPVPDNAIMRYDFDYEKD